MNGVAKQQQHHHHHDDHQEDIVPLHRTTDLVLALNTPKGRGVVAARDLPAYTVLDVCPVLPLAPGEENYLQHTSLHYYVYKWPTETAEGKKITTQAVIFGLGSMFNHRRDQNVIWERDTERLLVTYRTARDIKKGEELCISYGDRLNFKDVDEPREVEGDGSDMLNSIQLDL
ncbi:hypothetical protein HDK77DRAFT_24410 [Phyllosticta capitalensis]|uniref:SET domain-containing protein n=1 Tax=Phyllosticta capitalensis TaxID=121624 RepID=A0ABR1YZR6_9PEZI